MSRLLRACLYHRCSTLDQDPTLARDELRAAAKARGMEVVLEIEETGSGTRNDRPGLQRVLDSARRSEIDAVITWKLCRWGRSSLDVLANLRILEDTGVRFIASSQGIDIKPGGDAMSRLLVGMLAAIAEFERDLIRERTILGLAKARKRGKLLGRRVSRKAPNPTRVAELRDAGLSWSQVAAKLGCPATSARRALKRLPEKDSKFRDSSSENSAA